MIFIFFTIRDILTQIILENQRLLNIT